MRAVYTHHEALTFSGYLDQETGKTLVAEPGGTYDITPAAGAADEIPFPWFVPAGEDGEPAPLLESEPGPEGEPEPVPDEGQSF